MNKEQNAILVGTCIILAFGSGIATGISIYESVMQREPVYYGMYIHTYCDGGRVNGVSSLEFEFILGEYPIRLHAADFSSPWGSLGHTDGSYQNIPKDTQVNMTGFLLVNGTLLNSTLHAYSWTHRFDVEATFLLNGSTYIVAMDSPFGLIGYEISTAPMGSKWWNGGGRVP